MMRTNGGLPFARLYKGPSALGYDVGTKAWWDCAIRLNYRSVRDALARARYWSTRLTEQLAQRKPAKRRVAFLLDCLQEALISAEFWRSQARNTRLARETRIATRGPLVETTDDEAEGEGRE